MKGLGMATKPRLRLLAALTIPIFTLAVAILSLTFYLSSGPSDSTPATRGMILLSSYAETGQTSLSVSVPDIIPDHQSRVRVDFLIQLSGSEIERPPTIVMSGSFAPDDLTCVGESLDTKPGYLDWADLSDLERLGVQRYEMHPSGSGTITATGSRSIASGLTERGAAESAETSLYKRIIVGASGFVDRTGHSGVDGQTIPPDRPAGLTSKFSCYFDEDAFWHSVAINHNFALWRHFDFPTVVAISNNAGTDTPTGKTASPDYLAIERDATVPRGSDLTYMWSDLSEKQRAQAVYLAGNVSVTDTPQMTAEMRNFSVLVSSEKIKTARNWALFLTVLAMPLFLASVGRSIWDVATRFVETGRLRMEQK